MIEVPQHVVGIGRLGELCCMTGVAIGVLQLIVAVGMALRTQGGRMGTGQGELSRCMVKRCRFPCSPRMALQAVMVEQPGRVIGIGDTVEGRVMAVPAPGMGQSLEHIVHMALVAGHGLMRPDELEGRGCMAER